MEDFMPLVLREEDVRAVLTMPDTIRVLEAAFLRQGEGLTKNQPRRRVLLPQARGVLHVLSSYVPGLPADPAADGPGLVGFKAYTASRTGARFAVMLYSGLDGQLLAIIEADWLGRMRTGAASGVATRYLARDTARILGLIGTGGQARTQATAICSVRPISTILVYGRDVDRRNRFCSELSEELAGVSVEAVEAAEEAIRPADIAVTATTASEPVLAGDWLPEGIHLNVMGSNWANRREVDDAAIARSGIIAVDALDQAEIEAGDLLIPAAEGRLELDRVVELGAVVAGQVPGRSGDGALITLFKSLGIALEDVATAGLVYALARERGLGEDIAFLDDNRSPGSLA
jgi:ornithine cyclodeaminase/alanine dehydrogenase-like protein (mu-crystallin family)